MRHGEPSAQLHIGPVNPCQHATKNDKKRKLFHAENCTTVSALEIKVKPFYSVGRTCLTPEQAATQNSGIKVMKSPRNNETHSQADQKDSTLRLLLSSRLPSCPWAISKKCPQTASAAPLACIRLCCLQRTQPRAENSPRVTLLSSVLSRSSDRVSSPDLAR